jgi:hypothetical protein
LSEVKCKTKVEVMNFLTRNGNLSANEIMEYLVKEKCNLP